MESSEEMLNSSYDENSTEDDCKLKNEIDPWENKIHNAKETVRTEYDEQLKMLQMVGQFADIYVDNLHWMKNPIQKKICQKGFFDPHEALSVCSSW